MTYYKIAKINRRFLDCYGLQIRQYTCAKGRVLLPLFECTSIITKPIITHYLNLS
jgi:hypothetical protein